MEKVNQLTQERFIQKISELVSEGLGAEYQVERGTVRKNNGVIKETLFVRREDSDCAPSFYLEELYRSYCSGIPAEALTEHMLETVREECGDRMQITEFLSKTWLEENLFLRLVNFEKNLEQLEDAVYVRRLDLAAVFYVLTEQKEDGIKSFRLPKDLWESLEFGTAEEYFERIVRNTERLFPAEVQRMEDSLAECIRKSGEKEPEWLLAELRQTKEGDDTSLLYVLSNQPKINGAVVFLYPEMLSRLEERFPRGFYLIPSSIHEMLLLADSGETEAEELNRMVREVNETQVIPEEVLSDHVYYYSKTCGLCSRT